MKNKHLEVFGFVLFLVAFLLIGTALWQINKDLKAINEDLIEMNLFVQSILDGINKSTSNTAIESSMTWEKDGFPWEDVPEDLTITGTITAAEFVDTDTTTFSEDYIEF